MRINPAVNDIEWLRDSFVSRPTPLNLPTIPEFAETTKIVRGKYKGLPHRNDRSPFANEIMYEAGPQSDTQVIVVMGGAQWGKTVILSLIANYYTVVEPSEILYVTGAEASANKFAEREYVPRCKALGVTFRSQSAENTSRKSGNTAKTKEFDGGNVDFATANSINQLSSDTKRVILADEVSRWADLEGGDLGAEGSKWDNMLARAKQWGSQQKIIAVSTPNLENTCFTNALFLSGDQSYYFVPCPLCGHMHTMGFFDLDGYGLTYKTKGDSVIRSSIEYICPKCAKGFSEGHKFDILASGEWRSSAVGMPYTRSFYVPSGLISNFYTWEQTCNEWQQVQSGLRLRQSFFNLTLGKPFKDTGTTPKADTLYELRSTYRSGHVPDDVIYISVGIDAQAGAEKYRNMSDERLQEIIDEQPADTLQKTDLPRLEMFVLGMCKGYRSRAIMYKRFYGRVDDPLSGAWQRLSDFGQKEGLKFYDKKQRVFYPCMIFLDAGDGHTSMHAAMAYSEGGQNIYAIKGQKTVKRKKGEKYDDEIGNTFRRYRANRSGKTGVDYYLINTSHYKSLIYKNLKHTDPDHSGSILFPADFNDYYFDMLTAEEKLSDGTFEKISGRANEALDCFVYALCAGDVWLDQYVLDQKANAKTAGASPAEIAKIDKGWAVNFLHRALWG